jgi:hypothetical protein
MRRQMALLGIAAGLTAAGALADQCSTNFNQCDGNAETSYASCIAMMQHQYHQCNETCGVIPSCTYECAVEQRYGDGACEEAYSYERIYCSEQYDQCEG